MKNVCQCSNCGSKEVQGKAWVNLNDPTQIDYSLCTDKSSDYWCEECSDHTTIDEFSVYEPKDKVYWTDPEGISSGNYTVVEMVTEDGEDSVYLISNGTSEAEVFYHELS